MRPLQHDARTLDKMPSSDQKIKDLLKQLKKPVVALPNRVKMPDHTHRLHWMGTPGWRGSHRRLDTYEYVNARTRVLRNAFFIWFHLEFTSWISITNNSSSETTNGDIWIKNLQRIPFFKERNVTKGSTRSVLVQRFKCVRDYYKWF